MSEEIDSISRRSTLASAYPGFIVLGTVETICRTLTSRLLKPCLGIACVTRHPTDRQTTRSGQSQADVR
jgi:hypothetical protein